LRLRLELQPLVRIGIGDGGHSGRGADLHSAMMAVVTMMMERTGRSGPAKTSDRRRTQQ
jgi:hypothetical protein